VRIPRWALRHRITVEPYTGDSAYGAAYGPGVVVRCLVEDVEREVRKPTGEVVVSTTTVYALPGLVAPPQSRVTLPDGRKALVLEHANRDGGGLPTPDHVQLRLQ
jgi:hypothetical protein